MNNNYTNPFQSWITYDNKTSGTFQQWSQQFQQWSKQLEQQWVIPTIIPAGTKVKKMNYNSPSTPESLAKRPLSTTDEKWLAKLHRGKVTLDDLPKTVRMKLIGKGFIEVDIKLTEIGKKYAFVNALLNKDNQ